MKDCFVIDIITDMANVHSLVNTFFNDSKKTAVWMNSSIPLLGNQIPNDMIIQGRTDKLINFIETQLEENGQI